MMLSKPIYYPQDAPIRTLDDCKKELLIEVRKKYGNSLGLILDCHSKDVIWNTDPHVFGLFENNINFKFFTSLNQLPLLAKYDHKCNLYGLMLFEFFPELINSIYVWSYPAKRLRTESWQNVERSTWVRKVMVGNVERECLIVVLNFGSDYNPKYLDINPPKIYSFSDRTKLMNGPTKKLQDFGARFFKNQLGDRMIKLLYEKEELGFTYKMLAENSEYKNDHEVGNALKIFKKRMEIQLNRIYTWGQISRLINSLGAYDIGHER